MSRQVHAIVLAAGGGERMGGDLPKQFMEVAGRPLLAHALIPFETHPGITGITLVLPADQGRPPIKGKFLLMGKILLPQ